jgi:hypothetical protein
MKNVFWPIVIPEKLDEFKKKWGDWLVLSNTIEEEKTPGKLKTEFSTGNGEMICLSPKSYYISCKDTNKTKDGRKGIPNWADLRLEDFYSTLYAQNNGTTMTEVCSLRVNNDRKMTRTSTLRTGLSAIHVKLKIDDDRVTCRPLKEGENYI